MELIQEGEKIEIGEKVAGYIVIEKNCLFQIVEGELICDICNKKFDELIAIKESEKAYCNICFWKNGRKKALRHNEYINICLIKNKRN